MSSENVLKYVRSIFESTDIKLSVIEGQENFEKHYPCFAAVNRAAEGDFLTIYFFNSKDKNLVFNLK